MILPFLLALLAFVALLPIVAPLLRGSRPVAARASFDQAVYRDQLRELDRDIARGLISNAEADAARLEIQRRLLAADKLPAVPARLGRSPVLAVSVFLVIGIGSIGLYLSLGAPGVPDVPFASRVPEANGPNTIQQAADALAEKLKQNPSDVPGWLLYGRTLAQMGDWDQAEAAYRHAIDLGQTDPDVLGDHAEIMVMQAAGTVTPAAEAEFKKILQADPSSGIARYYLAVAAMQAGEPRKAIDGFQALLAEMPPDAPLRAQLGIKVAEAARAAGIPVPDLAQGPTPPPVPGPDAKAMADAASLPEAQKDAMVRGMVAQLAAKQEADPSNLDGWMRLGRAYAVLHEGDKAADAYDKAARLKPDDLTIPLQAIRALLSDRAPADRLSPRVLGLLKRVEAADPDQPLVLWYLGMSAAQEAHPDEAKRYWSKLLAQIPPGSDDSRLIKSAIDALAHR